MIQVGGDLLRTFAMDERRKARCLFVKMCFNTMNLYCSGKINNLKEWEKITEENIQQEKLRLINERIKKHNKFIYDSKGRLLI